MAKRLKKEKKQLEDDPPDYATAGPEGTDDLRWQAMIMGPDDTPYAGGVFNVALDFPIEYPFKPPKVKFTTKIYHPNIKFEGGDICMDTINDTWSPTRNVRSILETLYQLLQHPNSEDALEADIGASLRDKPAEFAKEATRLTEKYAM